MEKTRLTDVLFITLSHNITFIGKTWWILLVVLRLLFLLLSGFPLFYDEEDRFVCNTVQPGCANVCFDAYSPLSLLRFWLLHLLTLSLPHFIFVAYITHRVASRLGWTGGYHGDDNSRAGSLSTLPPPSSRETSLSKAPPLRATPLTRETPRFRCAYFLVLWMRILLEAAFGGAQYFLYGFSVPGSFRCSEAPCTSGVECYVSRPTEKTLMLGFALGASGLSLLVSLADLVCSLQGRDARSSRGEMAEVVEELSRGEQSSLSTGSSGGGGVVEEEMKALLIRSASNGASERGVRGDRVTPGAYGYGNGAPRGVVVGDLSPPTAGVRREMESPARAPLPTPTPTQEKDTQPEGWKAVAGGPVQRCHMRPPQSPSPSLPRMERGPGAGPPRTPTPMLTRRVGRGQSPPTLEGTATVSAEQQSEGSEAQDRGRAYV